MHKFYTQMLNKIDIKMKKVKIKYICSLNKY